MKIKNYLIAGLASLSIIALGGCGEKPVDPPAPDPEPQPEPEPIVIPTIDWDEKDYLCKGGSYGGYFADVNVNRMLCVGTDYDFAFESSHAIDKSYTVKSTNNDIAEPVKRAGNEKIFDLKCKSQGDIILTIENADGILVYRNIIRVRNAIKLDEMDSYLYSIDRFDVPEEFAIYFGEYKLSFNYLDEFDGKFCGTLKGDDAYDSNVYIIFTMEFDEVLPDRDSYSYKLTEIYTETQLTFVGYLNISRAGDWIYLYEDEELGTGGLLTMLVPRVIE